MSFSFDLHTILGDGFSLNLGLTDSAGLAAGES